jgi:hypothetical protein
MQQNQPRGRALVHRATRDQITRRDSKASRGLRGQWERILPPPRFTHKYCYIPNLNSVPGFLFSILMATMKTP